MEGQNLSHYKVLEKLGGGGMGVVYKALDTKLNRHVALKFLPTELTRDDEARKRFMLEAQAASALDHPNICTIYEIDESPDGQMFIAMGYYDGETLQQRIARGALPIAEALDITIQVAAGLAEAHSAGILHRDIKPANVIIATNGLVKIVDFGIAKLLGVTGPTQTGTTLGTVSYMSPEQVAGGDADQQSDVWSLGAVFYEMLAGQPPFKGESHWAVMNAIATQDPEPLSSLRPDVPAMVERVVTQALEKSKPRRFGSVTELVAATSACTPDSTASVPSTTSASGSWPTLLAPRVVIPMTLFLLALGVFGLRYSETSAEIRWARHEALPEIQRLLADDDYVAAFALAEEAERYIPDDPLLAELWPAISATGSIHVEPAQTDVYVRPYGAGDDEWQYLGQTPLENVRLPIGDFQWRLEKAEHESRVLAAKNPSTFFENLFGPTPPLGIRLLTERDVRDDMVHVPGGEFPVSLTGGGLARLVERVALDPFYIGRHEVTNREFQEFVDQEGYQNPEYWQHLTFESGDRTRSWEQTVAEFVDSTGQSGPSTWELGAYPPGEADHPVRGVSWFEAAAYARFRGKQLPTVAQWARAAHAPREINSPLSNVIVPLSNFDGEGPARVGAYQGIGPYGTYDMAGNVREWCWNELKEAGGRRVILGGAWSSEPYMSTLVDSAPAFDRSPSNGLRLVEPDGEVTNMAELMEPFDRLVEDLDTVEVVSDEVFEVFVRQASYSLTPLREVIEATEDVSEYWTRQKVSFDTPAGNQRVSAYIFLPKQFEPPYQPVIEFPGIGVFLGQTSSDSITPFYLDFVVRAGRALVLPIYQGSFERSDGRGGSMTRERTIAWRHDLGRTLDYLETRADMDVEKAGFFGGSYGASAALPLLALEDRLKAAVLRHGGLVSTVDTPPEANPVNYVPRITMPVLMLNGRYDYVFPVETSQPRLFESLGTRPEDKRWVVYEAGHGPLPRGQFIRETVTWFDTYLGPVN